MDSVSLRVILLGTLISLGDSGYPTDYANTEPVIRNGKKYGRWNPPNDIPTGSAVDSNLSLEAGSKSAICQGNACLDSFDCSLNHKPLWNHVSRYICKPHIKIVHENCTVCLSCTDGSLKLESCQDVRKNLSTCFLNKQFPFPVCHEMSRGGETDRNKTTLDHLHDSASKATTVENNASVFAKDSSIDRSAPGMLQKPVAASNSGAGEEDRESVSGENKLSPRHKRSLKLYSTAKNSALGLKDGALSVFQRCEAEQTGLTRAHEDACHKFLICVQGKWIEKTCAPGTAFSSVYRVCENRAKVDCGAGKESVDDSSFKCEYGYRYRMSYPGECRKFIECNNGELSIKSCGAGMLYDSTAETCDHSGKVQCRNSISSAEEQVLGDEVESSISRKRFTDLRETLGAICETGVRDAPHPVYCNKFVECDGKRVFEKVCGPGTVYNPKYRVCDWPYNVRRHFAGSCYSYLQCSARSGSFEQHFCPAKHAYDAKLGKCVYNPDCVAKLDRTTTKAPTTTSTFTSSQPSTTTTDTTPVPSALLAETTTEINYDTDEEIINQ